MEEIVMEIIAKIQQDKTENNIVPLHVLYYRDLLPEARRRISRALESLVLSGKVKKSNTINDSAYGLGD